MPPRVWCFCKILWVRIVSYNEKAMISLSSYRIGRSVQRAAVSACLLLALGVVSPYAAAFPAAAQEGQSSGANTAMTSRPGVQRSFWSGGVGRLATALDAGMDDGELEARLRDLGAQNDAGQDGVTSSASDTSVSSPVADDSEIEEGGNQEAVQHVTAAQRDFWQNLQPLTDQQDIRGFAEQMKLIGEHLLPGYTVTVYKKPTKIPFEKLTAKQAQTCTNWYSASTVHFKTSREWMDFYLSTVEPALRRFLAPLAMGTGTCRQQYRITKVEGGGLTYRLEGKKQLASLRRADATAYILGRFVDPEQVMNANAGDLITVEYTAYYLPRAFTVEPVSIQGSFALLVEEGDSQYMPRFVWSHRSLSQRGSQVFFSFCFMDELVVSYSFGEFYNTSPNPPKIRFTMHPEAYSQADISSSGKAPAGDNSPGLFMYILGGFCITVFVGCLGSLPYMIWVLYQEKKRVHVPLPEPAAEAAEENGQGEKLSPEFAEAVEFCNSLPRTIENGEEVPYLSRKVEVDQGYALLQALSARPNLNAAEVRFLNALGAELNAAQERQLNGSMKLPLFGTVICLLFAGLIVWKGEWGSSAAWLALLEFFSLPVAFFMSMKCPNYKLANPVPFYFKALHGLLALIGFGSLMVAADLASSRYATIYRDRMGNLYTDSSEAGVGCAIALMILMLVLLFSPFLVMASSLCNFYRNYVASK